MQRREKCLSAGGRLPGRSYELEWTLKDACFEKENAVIIAALVKAFPNKASAGTGAGIIIVPQCHRSKKSICDEQAWVVGRGE